jgi:hypothetical protein
LSYPRKRVSSGTRHGGASFVPGGSSKQPKFRQRRGILDARVRRHDTRKTPHPGSGCLSPRGPAGGRYELAIRGEVGSLISGRRLSAGSPPRLRNFDHIRNPQPIGDQRNRISKLRQRQDPLGQRTAQSCSVARSIYIDFTLTAKARSQVASSVSSDIAERMDGGGAHQDIKRAEPRDGSFYRRAGEIGLTRVAVKTHYDLLCREKIGDGEGVLRIADDGDLVAASGQERRRRQADARTSAQYERVLPSNSLSREGKATPKNS